MDTSFLICSKSQGSPCKTGAAGWSEQVRSFCGGAEGRFQKEVAGKAVDDALVFLDHFGEEDGPFACLWFVVGFVCAYNACINNVDIVNNTVILTG